MQYNKNDKIELTIVDMTTEGLGLAKIDGQVFFVKDAIIGDIVNAVITKVTKNIIFAKAIDIIEESKHRVKTKCKNANACGGCQLLNLSYDKQLELKKNNVINCLGKIAGIDVVTNGIYQGILGSDAPCHFRNKMQVPFASKDGKIIYGFYAGRTHYIVNFDFCMVGFKGAENILEAIKEGLEKYNISIYDELSNNGIFREALLRHGNTSNEVSITYIVNDKSYKKKIDFYREFDKFVKNKIEEKKIDDIIDVVSTNLNINTENNNVLIGKENILLSGKGYIEDNIGDIKYRISPESFYQVNMEMTKILYDKVLEYGEFTKNDRVLDLYCGIGTISLYVARFVKSVDGYEIIERAIEDAKINANINDIDNATFKCIDLSTDATNDIFADLTHKYDIVIVDPPRKGLDAKTIELLKKISAKKIVYVSCDPATLARDIKIICEDNIGYKVSKVCNVDMFPHTMHVECVVLLSKHS